MKSQKVDKSPVKKIKWQGMQLCKVKYLCHTAPQSHRMPVPGMPIPRELPSSYSPFLWHAEVRLTDI